MIITSIEQLTKNQYKVCFDDAADLTLTAPEFRELGLKPELELEQEAYEQIYQEYVIKKAKKKALQLLEHRDRTANELVMALRRTGFDERACQEALDYVSSYNYINDERYTENYLFYKSETKSRRQLAMQLSAKGVDSEKINLFMESAEIDDLESLRNLFSKKFGHLTEISLTKKQKIFNYFLNRGYQYTDISQVFKEFDINSEL